MTDRRSTDESDAGSDGVGDPASDRTGDLDRGGVEDLGSGRDGLDGGDDRGDDLVARYAISPDADEEEFLAAAKLYARAVVERHDLSVDVGDLDWRVSTRAKRRAGVVTYSDGEPEEVALTWEHFAEHGWAAAAGTVRHELAHVHLIEERDDASHGDAFERLAGRLDAPLHCERFAEPRFWVECTDCEARLARYRRSKLVEQPEEYRCADCGGAFRVREND